jgi:hypothetical protein
MFGAGVPLSGSGYQQFHRDLAVEWLALAAEIDGRGIVDPKALSPANVSKFLTAAPESE